MPSIESPDRPRQALIATRPLANTRLCISIAVFRTWFQAYNPPERDNGDSIRRSSEEDLHLCPVVRPLRVWHYLSQTQVSFATLPSPVLEDRASLRSAAQTAMLNNRGLAGGKRASREGSLWSHNAKIGKDDDFLHLSSMHPARDPLNTPHGSEERIELMARLVKDCAAVPFGTPPA